MRNTLIAAAAFGLAACSTTEGFQPTGNPAAIAGACRAVELGQPAPGDRELAEQGYARGLCGPDSYAAALWGGYPARR